MFVLMKAAVRAKKHLGQHFLIDENIAQRIAALLSMDGAYNEVIEIGPGTGVLTKYLINKPFSLFCLDVDVESVDYLNKHYSAIPALHILLQDFLKFYLHAHHAGARAVIGNFQYFISNIFSHTRPSGKGNRDRVYAAERGSRAIGCTTGQ